MDVPLGVQAGDMEISLRLSVGPTGESGEFLGFTLEEAKAVARALGCVPVVKRNRA
ncbi:MAG: hypothetical protein KGI89_01990 [Euryarchaeota archaeon]|nr:hypothetical protein [Euryarchaeota archaeon]